jgi:GT2 family glycosyltransferase
MITWDRLDYTKQTLDRLIRSREVRVIVIDNGSTDGTAEWLRSRIWRPNVQMIFNNQNHGIAHAMNQFRSLTAGAEYVGKVDNDTIVDPKWAIALRDHCRRHKLDIIQAAHPLIPEVAEGRSFEEWTSAMAFPAGHPEIRYHHFVGGSGIVIRRDILGRIPETEWKLYGWRQYQRENPDLVKAFCTDVHVDLLDANGEGYRDYPAYYKKTRRIK